MSTHKRQRTSSTCAEPNLIKKCATEESFRSYTLDTLPPEVLEVVLRFLPLHDVATTVRLVSRRCLFVATTILNGCFLAAGTKLENAIKRIEIMIPATKTKVDLVAFSRALNVLELIRAQYKMLRAVMWRYTHPPKQEKFTRLSFYAGSLLDDLNNLIRRAISEPTTLSDSRGPDPSVTCFMSDCKRFMNYFEKVSERRANRSALVSGCKVIDILDCLAEGRQVLSFKTIPAKGIKCNVISMKLKYVMKRAWFTCLEVPISPDENSWRDEQRFMYLRLRRLVCSVNEHYFEKLHYEREVLLQKQIIRTPRPPPASTYSGYGEYGGRFYYYGNMNKYAYESKFKRIPSTESHEPARERETEGETCVSSSFDLTISVDLKCSPELAPLAVRTSLKSDELETCSTRQSYNCHKFELKLNIACPASAANRLPENFTWELHAPGRSRHHS